MEKYLLDLNIIVWDVFFIGFIFLFFKECNIDISDLWKKEKLCLYLSNYYYYCNVVS